MKRRRLQTLISSSIIAAFAATGLAQETTADDKRTVLDPNQAAQLHLAALSIASATGPVKALAEGTTVILEAVIMEVRGRCQWRVDEKAKWKKAAIDDRLKPGAMIRTGLKSHLAMRCGPNATILVDSNSRVVVPSLAQDGDRLSTIVQVNRGRADFKVDHVGLTNDFSVVTPSGALSVRGTGMGVAYDGFDGTSVHGARFNSINAMEMRYYGSKKVWSVSGPGSTSSRAKNPTNKAVSKTIGGKPLNKAKAMAAKSATKGGGPPPMRGGLQETTRTVLAAQQGVRERQRLDEEIQEQIEEEEAQNPPPPPADDPPPPPPPPPAPPAHAPPPPPPGDAKIGVARRP
ncbi:MAG: FecR family protein, partial [Phycisphaerales bacterium]|nr:FecR family protein [Phycisphaerales bacterium]